MTNPVCPNCKNVDRGARLPSDHGGEFFFTRCGNCNHGYRFNSKGEVASDRELPPSKDKLDAIIDKLCRCTTLVYQGNDCRSLNRALDKICDGVGIVVKELRAMRASHEPPAVLEKQRDHWRKQCRDLQDILRNIGECISGHDGHVFDDVHALLEQSQALNAPTSSQPPSPSPLTKVAAAFAGKVKDSYILKLWFESQEDLDAAFDMVDDVNPILPVVPDSDPTKESGL